MELGDRPGQKKIRQILYYEFWREQDRLRTISWLYSVQYAVTENPPDITILAGTESSSYTYLTVYRNIGFLLYSCDLMNYDHANFAGICDLNVIIHYLCEKSTLYRLYFCKAIVLLAVAH
jgi:hypothetical protein